MKIAQMKSCKLKRWAVGLALALSSYAHVHAHQCYADPKQAYQALIAKQSAQKVMSERVNINTASMGELATLNGVGAKTAQAIVDYREGFGRFERVDDLTKVKGIGVKTLEKNRHRLTVH
ncbi:ComEA family DNA-binding protein [Moraxella bovis]|uniref:Competence protein ComEA helix-hairpin-helix repeat region n=1 Tax=Moraxella bovis TaxID=476 RepID=A0A378PRJ7_MORBO|nr:ComEA family DNA-binding protein [Moraxella bovis]STY90749.1 competence protein ComEA helix-hairpin-helix repeat region [Moraxella bovis]